jgi:hypothetical protein
MLHFPDDRVVANPDAPIPTGISSSCLLRTTVQNLWDLSDLWHLEGRRLRVPMTVSESDEL